MNDTTIIDLLFERSEQCLSLLTDKYKALAVKILSEILTDRSDVEECFNDLLLAVWNSIPPQRPHSMTAYVCTLTRRIGINRYNYNHRSKRDMYQLLLSELDEAIPDPTSEEPTSGTEITDVLNRFVKALDPEGRVLFLRRYVYFESVADMAARFGMSENAISSRLFRMRKKLQKMLREENIEV
ncbi:MAG: sigma-70 family RNA polymerase sigma factor [Ruminococcaceae bacterium]|nr:sigma-70 family RNA polymerase sigma factor [Oscillospiraceae bacterium]